jgi:putative sigma-54 modulation protein
MSIPIQFTNRNGSGSETLMQKTTEKFERLYKFASNITKIHVIFNTDNLVHIAEAEVHIPKMKPVYAEAKSEDMYKSVDSLVDKLTKQLSKHKEKVTEH